jgi:predicted nucleic acid-binding protein
MRAPNFYSADTSALIDGLERYYPEETFPALWREVDGLIAANRFFISEEVWEEARVRDAAAKSWCASRGKDALVVPTDVDVVQEVQSILQAYPKLIKNMKGRNRADAFVIAVARLKGAIVVTGEGVNGTQDRPKIPYICEQLGVECIRFVEIIRLEGWKF